MISRVPGAVCPACSKRIDGAAGPRAPMPGDLTVCVYCAAVSKYVIDGRSLVLVVLTEHDISRLPDDLRAEVKGLQRRFRKH